MPVFELSYADDGKGLGRTIQFDADDAAQALKIAQSVKRGRVALLSRDAQPVCLLERRGLGGDSDIWVVAPPAA